MKRLIFSIVGGLLFPIVYIYIALSVARMFPQYFAEKMYLFGRPAPGLIFVPIAVPLWAYNVIEYYQYLGLPFILYTVWFKVMFVVGFDVFLYIVLIYGVLWYFGIFAGKTQPTSETPPPPPTQF